MAREFVSSVLDLLSGQTSKTNAIEFSHAPTKFQLKSKNLRCTCQDDGAIVRREWDDEEQKWATGENLTDWLLCSLEVKPAYMEEDDSGRGTLSDKTLAQQFCELLGAVMSAVGDGDLEDLEEKHRQYEEPIHSSTRSCFIFFVACRYGKLIVDSRFLISVHQSTMNFLYCTFSEHYLEYIYSRDVPETLPHITIHRSIDYDLSHSNSRERVAEMLVALTLYFDEKLGNAQDVSMEDAG